MHKFIIPIIVGLCLLTACDNETSSETAAPVQPAATDAYYFSSNRSGNYEIYRMEDGQVTALTANSRYDSWWPRQSPDGSTMLFYRSLVSARPTTGGHNNNYDNAALWSLDLATSIESELIPVNGYDWNAQGVVDWSPDGRSLIMAAIENSTNRWHLFVTDATARNPVQVSQRTSLYLDPSWSPDGSQITYAAFPEDYNGFDLARLEIFIADSDGNNEQRLTNDNLRDHDPYWSPNGHTIAFETAVDPTFAGVGRWALRAVDLGESSIEHRTRTLFDDGNINTLPRWSNDSQEILFHRFIFGSGHGFIVARMNANGTAITPVTTGGNFDDTDLDYWRPTITNRQSAGARR